ncbi:hypothetical protein CAPTEDRAFT_194606, partial [Capitella teleta]
SQKSGACRIHLADVNALVWFNGWNLVMLYIIPVLLLAYMYYHIILALKKSISLTKTMRSNGKCSKQTDEDHNDSDIKDRKQPFAPYAKPQLPIAILISRVLDEYLKDWEIIQLV